MADGTRVQVTIVIHNIEVDEKYYSFDYVYQFTGEESVIDTYSSDHNWEDLEAFKEYILEEGGVKTVFGILSDFI